LNLNVDNLLCGIVWDVRHRTNPLFVDRQRQTEVHERVECDRYLDNIESTWFNTTMKENRKI
jgi:hypothetical protein